MRYATYILIAGALAALLLICHRRNPREGRWEQHRAAMQAFRPYLRNTTAIGCRTDSAHIFDYLQCRYWLLPARTYFRDAARDTQLVLDFTPSLRPLQPEEQLMALHRRNGTTYRLVKRRS